MIGKASVKINGERYWQTKVSCNGTARKPRIISKTINDNGEWCGRDAPGFCRSERVRAAILVCSVEYKEAVLSQTEGGEVEPAKNPEQLKIELIAEQMEIRSQQLDLDRRRLEVQRREFELQKEEEKLQQRLSGAQ